MKSGYVVKAALAGLALVGTLGTSVAMAADGKALYTEKLCATCHGAEGKAPITPLYPKLNGQNKDYLAAQIKLIKDGTRTGGLTAAMKPMVASLTDDEIAAISDYLSQVK